MPKFIAVTDKTEDPGPPKIRFTTDIDEDGDFIIYANGVRIAWIDAEDGDLCLSGHFTPIPGLAYDTEKPAHIKVWKP